jgi:ATP-dependent exoDNAse (exonuclease V) beta subunit
VLQSLDVPFRIDSGDRPLADEPAVRAVIDLCRASLLDEADDEVIKAVLNSPLIGLHPYEIRDLEREAFRTNTKLAELVDTSELDGVAEFRRLRDAARASADETADATFAHIFDISKSYADLVARRYEDHDAAHQLDALIAFAQALGRFVERHPSGRMRDYLGTLTERGFVVETWSPTVQDDGVHLLSFHASKGKEWDLACVLGVAEGLIPRAHRAQGLFDPWALESGSAVDRAQAQLAEERRTLYVALTRAREKLVVSASPGTRRATPSRFLEEAFGTLPEPIVPGSDLPPLTLAEAAARHRRTLALADSTDDERAAAAAALASIPGVRPTDWWWRRDFTDGSPLTPTGKLVTSYSRIGRYDNCPLQYVLESVLGLDPASTYQMKFGSLVHRIFEKIDLGEITSREQAGEYYRTEFMSHHREDYPNIQFARTYYTAGVKMINLWWETERNKGEVVAIEYKFDNLEVDGHTIRGRIDRITKDANGGIVLTDYKTSKTAVSYDEARESLQLAIYYKVARTDPELRKQGMPVRMELVYPGIKKHDYMDGEYYADRRTQRPDQAEEALAKLQTYLDEAASEHFAPSAEADCRWCRMKMLCPRWPEGKEIPR